MWIAWLLAGALAAGAAAPIDDPPDTTNLSLPEATEALAAWCPTTTVEILPAPEVLPGGPFFVRQQELVNQSSAQCTTGPLAPKIRLRLYTVVPDLRGLSIEEARALLAPRALLLSATAAVAPGGSLVVIEQVPLAGTEIEIDAWPFVKPPVRVAFGRPTRTVPVPDLRTWREDEACATLTQRGLTCEVQASGDGAPPGTVGSQRPEPGTRVALGTPVILLVDRPVPVPTPTPAPVVVGPPEDPGTPVAYLAGSGLLVLLLLGVLVYVLRPRARRPDFSGQVVTSARVRVEPGPWRVEELPGRPNLTVGVRVVIEERQ